jgi:uncharacterized protein DUF2798
MARKIAFRYRAFLFALIMSFTTSLMVSGTILYLHTDSFAQFMKVWLPSFAVAWPLVLVAILVIPPLINKLLNLFVEDH